MSYWDLKLQGITRKSVRIRVWDYCIKKQGTNVRTQTTGRNEQVCPIRNPLPLWFFFSHANYISLLQNHNYVVQSKNWCAPKTKVSTAIRIIYIFFINFKQLINIYSNKISKLKTKGEMKIKTFLHTELLQISEFNMHLNKNPIFKSFKTNFKILLTTIFISFSFN